LTRDGLFNKRDPALKLFSLFDEYKKVSKIRRRSEDMGVKEEQDERKTNG
jgi:hypothetical protein